MKIFMKIVLPSLIIAIIIFIASYLIIYPTRVYGPPDSVSLRAMSIHGIADGYVNTAGDKADLDGVIYYCLNDSDTDEDDQSGIASDGTAADLRKSLRKYCGSEGYCRIEFEKNVPVRVFWCSNDFSDFTEFDNFDELRRRVIGVSPYPSDELALMSRKKTFSLILLSAAFAFVGGSFSAAVTSVMYISKNKKRKKM